MLDPTMAADRLTSLSSGAGCACKLPLAALDRLIGGLVSPNAAPGAVPSPPATHAPAAGTAARSTRTGARTAGAAAASTPFSAGEAAAPLVGLAEGDDAAVLRLDDERALIMTTDFFPPIVDSPYDWGRIAAANALSDVYAMGGRPLAALNLAAWPHTRLPIEMLGDVMRGGAAVAASAGCAIVGGHTIDDPVPKYGMAVVGTAHPDRLLTIDRAAPGNDLVLTKPLGTGVAATALKRSAVSATTDMTETAVRAAIESMTTLNAVAGDTAVRAGVRAATDVTGFGLLGHLHRMLRASGCAAEIDATSVPFLPGTPELAAAGHVSGGTRANIDYLAEKVDMAPGVRPEIGVLLHDAQTSGGLLLAVPPTTTGALLRRLRARGVPAASIGRVTGGAVGEVTVRDARTPATGGRGRPEGRGRTAASRRPGRSDPAGRTDLTDRTDRLRRDDRTGHAGSTARTDRAGGTETGRTGGADGTGRSSAPE